MWSDVDADPPLCPASGKEAASASRLADDSPAAGFPDGRARCPECDAFVPLIDGRLHRHDRFRGTDDVAESAARAEWFNTFGWQ